jgi:hypothetical protein
VESQKALSDSSTAEQLHMEKLKVIEKYLLMHVTQAIPIKELKKWTKSVVKKQNH